MAPTSTIQARSEAASSPRPSASPRPAAQAATVTAAGFVALVSLLHVLKPELEPSWRMVSEYEIGRHGWVMRVAFGCLAVACLGLHRALRDSAAGAAATVGRAGLLAGAAGTAIAGAFASDPITATKDQLTTQGNLHGLGFALGMPGMLLAVSLLTRALRRTQPHLAGPVRAARAAVWASLAAFLGTMVLTYDGAFTADVPIGWPNRVLVVALVGWVIVAADLVRRAEPG